MNKISILPEAGLGLRALLVLMVSLASPQSHCSAGESVYNDFSRTNGLILKEHAASRNGHLRLTPAIPGLGLGGVWLDHRQPVKNGFVTTFQIQITEKYNSGADGFAFVIQGNNNPKLGQTGQGLGYGGVSNQFVVHFDNYHWNEHPDAGKYDEIAVLASQESGQPLFNHTSNFLASVNRKINYSDGAIHTVRLIYLPGNLEVFLDDLENPVMTVYLNISKLVDLDDEGKAWVGFTGSGGKDWQNQDIVSWIFSPTSSTKPLNSPIPLADFTQSPVANPIYLASNSPPTDLKPLELDRAFGFGVPPGIGLDYDIEVSTNLLNWSPFTNSVLYFKDTDSHHYDRRFYRFVPRR